MRIREVEQLTGLSRKTIRFYEEKGLLSVERSCNSYREYDENIVERLKNIATLRKAGISLADIQLWQDSVISTEEMLNKRLSELKDNADVAADQVKLCHVLLSGISNSYTGILSGVNDILTDDTEADNIELDNLPDNREQQSPHCIGIDIGTTTISAVVLNLETAKSAGVYTVISGADIPSENSWEKMQDAKNIVDRVTRLVDSLVRRYKNIVSIGFTGQMHGIVYLDKDGNAVSPLYTWQDNRAGVKENGESSCDIIKEKTGYKLAPGYGLATHFDLMRHNAVPNGAKKLCTVMDYAVCAMCGKTEPLTHSSNAASMGFYKIGEGFDNEAAQLCGIDTSILPETTERPEIAGYYNGIPVSVAIGDNQSSFLGSVKEMSNSVLINFGTGSQITVVADVEALKKSGFTTTMDVEIRPFLENSCLLSGSALCGGRAYAILEHFFRSYAIALGLPDSEQYETMNKLAEAGMNVSDPIFAETTFCGTRSEPDKRGTLTGIGDNNFTASSLTVAVLRGMVDELYGMYEKMPNEHIGAIVVSGNAARKNPSLRKTIAEKFGMNINVPEHFEEAAYGAAMFSCIAGKSNYAENLGEFIRYIGK